MSTRTLKKLASLFLILGCMVVATVKGQESSTASSVVPRLVQFSGIVTDSAGRPAVGTESVTFSLYELQEGGTPLWSETQSLALDAQGHYTAFLGAASPDGLPLDLFTTGSARWLGIAPQLPGVGELPRVLLVGVPYALKAADADTLGGKPASAFVTVESPSSSAQNTDPTSATSRSTGAAAPGHKISPMSIGGSGTLNYIPIWTDSSGDLGNSLIYQTSGNIGIGTARPGSQLDVAGIIRSIGHDFDTFGAQIGFNRDATTGQIFNSTYNAYQVGQPGDQSFQIQQFASNGSSIGSPLYIAATGDVTLAADSGGNVGIGTLTPGVTLDVNGKGRIAGGLDLNSQGSMVGFNRNVSTGQIYNPSYNAFQVGQNTADQSFQIQQYAANGSGMGAPLFVGSTGNVGLAIGSGRVGIGIETPAAELDVAGSVKIEGTGNGITFPDGSILKTAGGAGGTITGVTAGTDLTGGGTSGTVTLNLDTTKVPQLAAANTFSASQTVGGTVKITGSGNGVTFSDGSTQTTAYLVNAFSVCTSYGASTGSACNCNGSHVQSQVFVYNGQSCTANTGNSGTGSSSSASGQTVGSCCVCH